MVTIILNVQNIYTVYMHKYMNLTYKYMKYVSVWKDVCGLCVCMYAYLFFLSHFNDDQKSLAEGSCRDLRDLQSNTKTFLILDHMVLQISCFFLLSLFCVWGCISFSVPLLNPFNLKQSFLPFSAFGRSSFRSLFQWSKLSYLCLISLTIPKIFN